MGKSFNYYEDMRHLPDDVRKAIKAIPYERRKRLLILTDMGTKLTVSDVAEYNKLTDEHDIDRFIRRFIFRQFSQIFSQPIDKKNCNDYDVCKGKKQDNCKIFEQASFFLQDVKGKKQDRGD